MQTRELDLLRLAQRHGGCFTRRDALAAGFSPSAIQRRLAGGQWLHCGGSAMRAAATLPSLQLRQHAALDSLGPGSFLSHTSASAFHGFTRQPSSVWCSVPHAKRVPSLPDVVIVRTRHVDYVTRNGLRVARPERAFCDLAMLLPRDQLAAVLASAVQAGQVQLDVVREVSQCLFGRPGTADLAAVLEEFRPEFESTLGREFHELVSLSGIGGVVAGFTIRLPDGRSRIADGAVEALRLCFEADGFAYHGLPHQMQADKERDRELALHLWRTARFTTEDIRRRRERTLSELPRIVAARAREIGIWQ